VQQNDRCDARENVLLLLFSIFGFEMGKKPNTKAQVTLPRSSRSPLFRWPRTTRATTRACSVRCSLRRRLPPRRARPRGPVPRSARRSARSNGPRRRRVQVEPFRPYRRTHTHTHTFSLSVLYCVLCTVDCGLWTGLWTVYWGLCVVYCVLRTRMLSRETDARARSLSLSLSLPPSCPLDYDKCGLFEAASKGDLKVVKAILGEGKVYIDYRKRKEPKVSHP
jgi:hypothetical protein